MYLEGGAPGVGLEHSRVDPGGLPGFYSEDRAGGGHVSILVNAL